MPKKYIFNKKVTPNFYFSAQKPARETYSGHSWGQECPQEDCPLQDKFQATPMFKTTKKLMEMHRESSDEKSEISASNLS